MNLLNTKVLVLNRSYIPTGFCIVKDAFRLMFQDVCDILDGDLQPFDWNSWTALKVEDGMQSVKTVSQNIRVPRIIRLHSYNKVPERVVTFSSENVIIRDKYICQYCGSVYNASKLNMDHVFPKSRGGKTTWTNIVTSCRKCNTQKADRTPKEAGMRLRNRPYQPKWTQTQMIGKKIKVYPEWKIFFKDKHLIV